MNELIAKIFNLYKYIEVKDIGSPNISFYKHELIEIANYFIINSIDCRDFEDDAEQVLSAMEQLEKDYLKGSGTNSIALKKRIIDSFSSDKEASQLDKNTSAVYLMLFNNIESLNDYRNAVYSIEESPNYFKRYVLPYTLEQMEQLNLALCQYQDRSIHDALCQIVDNEENYLRLVNSKDLNSTYGLAIRMFSKLPFLQYKFKTELAPEPIEKQFERIISSDLMKYHEILNNSKLNIDEILSLEDGFSLDEEELGKELQELLKGVKQ